MVCINWSTLAVHLPFSWWFPGQPTRSYSPTTWWILSIALMWRWQWLKPSFQSSRQKWTIFMLTSRALHWLCKVRTWYIYASVYLYTLEFEFWLFSKSSLDFWRQNLLWCVTKCITFILCSNFSALKTNSQYKIKWVLGTFHVESLLQ